MIRNPREWRFDRVTPPAFEPVTVADVQAHSRIDSDDPQLSLVPLMISAARKYAEKVTGRSFLKQSWLATGDSFPGGGIVPAAGAYAYAHPLERHSPEIILLNGPVVSVESIAYLDTTGAQQTLDPSVYVVDASGGLNARVAPAAGQQWPATRHQIAAVQVAYTAGRGAGATESDDVALVDENIRQWILIRIATAWEHREEVEALARGKIEPMVWVDGLLDIEREWAI